MAETAMTTSIKTYSELIRLTTFEERFNYLRLDGVVGRETFGFHRYLNQKFYQTDKRWLSVRDKIIIRDAACDLAIKGRDILSGIIIVHHINPVIVEDLVDGNPKLFDPENLICTTHNTHNAIHYGEENLLIKDLIIRTPNDTCPWRR